MMIRVALIASTLGLVGCATTPDVMARPEATAVREVVRLEMPVNPLDNGLTWEQQNMIAAVAAEYKVRGHGPLIISYPQNAGNADAAISAIALARTQLYEHGLNWQQIGGSAYEARGRSEAPVVFSFYRYEAVAPECGNSWRDERNTFPGSHVSDFGCATATNMAAMISDPRDLLTPRTMDDPDHARRQNVLDQWRQGVATATERSGGESGAVSSVVE